MKRISFTVMLATMAVFAAAQTASPTPAQKAYAAIKKLKGTWQGEMGKETFKVVYKVTGGGATVIETQMPDTEMEMVTIYHLDGPNKLVLTHYCAAMNQPTMKLAAGGTDKAFKFNFVSGSNMKATDMHIHNVRYKILSDDHIITEWEGYAKGKPAGTETFDLKRVKE
ncbi:hypothetical protein EON81_00630 [bacterium]|nr:MAG: hypothetical protein EON81_00630 [bacterium]